MTPSAAQKVYAAVAAIGACAHQGGNCQDIGEVAAISMSLGSEMWQCLARLVVWDMPIQNFASMAPDAFDATSQFTMGKVASVAFGKSGGTGALSTEIQKDFAAGKQAIIEHLSNSGSASELMLSKFSLKNYIASFGAAAAKRKGQIKVFNAVYNAYYTEASGGSGSSIGGGPIFEFVPCDIPGLIKDRKDARKE